jgi:hypothetical protein
VKRFAMRFEPVHSHLQFLSGIQAKETGYNGEDRKDRHHAGEHHERTTRIDSLGEFLNKALVQEGDRENGCATSYTEPDDRLCIHTAGDSERVK